MVRIFVGPERVEYNLHKELLCERSSFFQAAFEGPFQEGQEKVMNLPEDSMASFEILVLYVYGSALAPVAPRKVGAYIRLYGLAEKLCMENLANEVVDMILVFFRGLGRLVRPNQLELGYSVSSPGSGLRRYLSDSIVDVMLRRDLGPLSEQGLKDFARCLVEVEDLASDFVFALKKLRSQNQLVQLGTTPCCYHDHKQTLLCNSATSV
jgi:BTB/POZ domain